MEIDLAADADENFLCEWHKIIKANDAKDLINTYKYLKNQNPDYSFLFTLDDISQACYTSMHSKMYNDLDNTEGYDLSSLNVSCFEDGEHKGYLSTVGELFIREGNFLKGVNEVTLDQVFEKGISLFNDDINSFKDANDNIMSIIDTSFYILKVGVRNSYETLYAFPNGYFSSDLNPFENYVFARYMQLEFGYNLIGIGSSYIAFIKTTELNDQLIPKLLNFLMSIYRNDFDEALLVLLTHYIKNNELLVLRYTE